MTGAHHAPRRLHRVHRVASAAVLTLLVVCTAALVAAHLQGARFLPVLTGSMSPYAPAGSLVLTVPVAGEDVVPGDVIAFRPPAPFQVAGDRAVLHRVVSLDTQDGQPFLTTQGDANATVDPWQVLRQDARFGRSVLVVPVLGRVVAGGGTAALALVLGTAALLAGGRALLGGRQHRAGPCDCLPSAVPARVR